jgi:hypothetical protein
VSPEENAGFSPYAAAFDSVAQGLLLLWVAKHPDTGLTQPRTTQLLSGEPSVVDSNVNVHLGQISFYLPCRP